MNGSKSLAARIRRETRGHCPAHDDRDPSLSVDAVDGRVLIYCHAGCSFERIRDALQARGLWWAPHLRHCENDKHTLADHAPENNGEEKTQNRLYAQELWERAVPVPNTLAEKYLRKWRGITMPLPDNHLKTLGFLAYMRPTWRQPCLIVGLRNGTDRITAVQVTFLDPDTAKKVKVRIKGKDLSRQTFGPMADGAAAFGMPNGGVLGLAEGTETALSATQLFDIPCWATCGVGRLHKIAIPDNVKRLHLYADNDQAGIPSAERAANLYLARGLEVKVIRPRRRRINDFNDLVRAMQEQAK